MTELTQNGRSILRKCSSAVSYSLLIARARGADDAVLSIDADCGINNDVARRDRAAHTALGIGATDTRAVELVA